MIKSYARAKIEDGLKKNDLFLETNFDETNKNLIKITLGDNVCVVKRDDLWNFIFSVVKIDQQRQMIPVEKSEMVKYIKQHTVILQKDLKKGDTMAVNCEVNIRKEVDDAVRREIEEQKLSTVSPYVDTKKI